ncbi:MAG: LLM class flavin-dependent oxidoreductase [Acidimicrobiia bacterium]|nr:LLM class flavin-dependent oxidoreductase [Acidimicrobiia bacterium]NNC42838.1 LLM class flavin-dependent oxidoreductase [Acidimicrobiia bacterium]NNF65653.1 LLM class flavin-dependent oxidoreductase [Acidimicrobiia bacterium]
MQIGIQLPEIERVVPWNEYREMAVLAEDVGFDSLWLGDHLLYDKPEGPKGPWECWTLLAAVAAVTERVLLGPLVSPTGFRKPALLAKMAGTVDEIANGRLILGLGSGWNQREFEAFGAPFDKRVSRFEEAFTIITSLIRTGRADFHGQYHDVTDSVLVPPARSDMPIMIGSTGPRMLGITAREMDWWNEWWNRFDNSPEGVRPLTERVDAAVRAVGRSPDEIVKSAAVMVQLEDGTGRQMGAVVSAPPIDGSAREIADRLLAFDGLIHHLQLVVDPITTESIEKLAPVVEMVHAG